MTGTTPPKSPSQPQVARMIWLVLGPIVCAVMGLATVSRLRPNENKLHDFVQEWTSARNWLQGEPIYEDLRRSVADDIKAELVPTLPIIYNAHPPASVLLTLPFGVLNYHQSVVLWNWLSVGALGASLALIMGQSGLRFPRWMWWPVVSLLLLSSPLAHQVYMAQLNLVLLLLYTLAWWLDRSERSASSGACIGIAAAIKIFPGFLFLYFLAQRRYRALISGAATFLVLNVLSAVVLGTQAWKTYLTEVMPAVTGFRAAWENASVPGFWAKLFDSPNPVVQPLIVSPTLARAGTVLSSLALLGITFWAVRRASGERARDSAFATCAVATLLLSPIVWPHYFVILTLPLLILWRYRPGHGITGTLLVIIIVLLGINPAWLTGVNVPIPGPGGTLIQPLVATPLKTLIGLSFQFYTLLLLWLLGCIGSGLPRSETYPDSFLLADRPSSPDRTPDSASQPVHN